MTICKHKYYWDFAADKPKCLLCGRFSIFNNDFIGIFGFDNKKEYCDKNGILFGESLQKYLDENVLPKYKYR